MAKNSIRFRFVINQRGGGNRVQSEARNAVSGAMESIVFRYAEGTYLDVKNKVVSRIHADIMTELSFMAGNFKSSVIGIAGNRKGPNGFSSMAHEMASVSRSVGIRPSASNSAGVNWPARKSKYMDWKRNHYHHSKWFLNNGDVLASTMGKRASWIGAFGPIQVSVQHGSEAGKTNLGTLSKRQRVSTRAGYTRFRSAEDSHFRIGIANIKVAALTKITPRMLPALASGQLGSYNPDGRRSGLLGMLPEAVAVRLGGSQKHVPYRHTIEPFLSFVLTQAVPNALFLRVERGLGTKLDAARRTR